MKSTKLNKIKQFLTPQIIVASSVLLVVLIMVIVGPVFSKYDPDAIDLLAALQKPSAEHFLGTDYIGRDQFTRLLYGGRTSLINALLVVLLAMGIGIPMGMISGYYGGIVDSAWMRICDFVLSFPILMLAFVLVIALGRGGHIAVIAIAIVYIPGISKLARSLIITEKTKGYVETCRSVSFSDKRIIFLHILPNCIPTMVAELTMDFGAAIITLTSLSFLGLGVQAPQADWGCMLNEAMGYIFQYPFLVAGPAVAIICVSVATNILSDGIMMYLDPAQRKTGKIKSEKRKSNTIKINVSKLENNILEIRNLKMDLMSVRGIVHTVRGVDMNVKKGEIHGIVGESGCGKSMLVKSVMRLHDEKKCAYQGEIIFDNKNILALNNNEMLDMRGKDISMIFQEPMNSLDMIMKVGHQIEEMLMKKENMSRSQAKERTKKLLEQVGLEPVEQRMEQYPFEMSGGMMQRVMIAMAMACRPKLLIADEPTTALDVTIQKQILELMLRIRDKYNMAIMIVTHNLGVVAEICDSVSVMYAGQVVEDAKVSELFSNPKHPYTKALMASNPTKGKRGESMVTIPGEPPKLTNEIVGCAFASRCPYADELCKTVQPPVHMVGTDHMVACHHFGDISLTEKEKN